MQVRPQGSCSFTLSGWTVCGCYHGKVTLNSGWNRQSSLPDGLLALFFILNSALCTLALWPHLTVVCVVDGTDSQDAVGDHVSDTSFPHGVPVFWPLTPASPGSSGLITSHLYVPGCGVILAMQIHSGDLSSTPPTPVYHLYHFKKGCGYVLTYNVIYMRAGGRVCHAL